MENSQIKFNKEKATQSILYVANKLERRDLHKILLNDYPHFCII